MEASATSSETRIRSKLPSVGGNDEEPTRIERGALLDAIHAFEGWLSSNGNLSFDPYDIWGTRYGLAARRLYYRKHPLGLPLIAPLLLMEIVCPSVRSTVVERSRFATADAQLLLGFLNLYASTQQPTYLTSARRLADDLLSYSINGYRGYCWGYPFDWQNQRGLWERNTPYITCTPYCFEAYLGLHEATGDARFAETAKSIADFVYHDLRDTETASDAAAASYSPKDDSQVINASAYRAWVLFEAGDRFQSDEFQEKATRNLNFVLQNQRPDGSWWYAADSHGRFIDHFHTCFVLKNLFKLNRITARPGVSDAIRRGYDFYRRELFYPDGNPKSFAVQPRTGIVRLEMYNFAEAITLGVLLREEIPEAFGLAERLAIRLIEDFQLSDGHFVTRVYNGGIRHTFPFLRWPQSQLFLALTNIFAATTGSSQRATLASSRKASDASERLQNLKTH